MGPGETAKQGGAEGESVQQLSGRRIGSGRNSEKLPRGSTEEAILLTAGESFR